MPAKCVGISWYYGQPGPHGGGECILYWEMTASAQVIQTNVDSARLHNEALGYSVVVNLGKSFCSCYYIVRFVFTSEWNNLSFDYGCGI
jgi:hypothetical protein